MNQEPELTRSAVAKRGAKWASALVAAGNSAAVRFPNTSCGSTAHRRFLVAYASAFGATGEVAETVAAELCSAGSSADTTRVRDVDNIERYDGVVVGAAVQFDNWMSEAREFVAKHAAALSAVPVAYFFTCLTLADPSADATRKAQGYAVKVEKGGTLRVLASFATRRNTGLPSQPQGVKLHKVSDSTLTPL